MPFSIHGYVEKGEMDDEEASCKCSLRIMNLIFVGKESSTLINCSFSVGSLEVNT